MTSQSIPNLVLFCGCDRKTGTTMVSQCVARYLAKEQKKKVLWLDCSGAEDGQYLAEELRYLDSFRAELQNGLLTAEELLQLCRSEDGCAFLGGFRHPRCWRVAEDLQRKTAEAFCFALNLAVREFELVILDGGSFPLTAPVEPLVSLAGQHILVMTQLESSVTAARRIVKDPRWRPVVNRYRRDDPHDLFYLEKDLAASVLPVEASLYGRRAEWERKPLLTVGGKAYRRSLTALAETIGKEADVHGTL